MLSNPCRLCSVYKMLKVVKCRCAPSMLISLSKVKPPARSCEDESITGPGKNSLSQNHGGLLNKIFSILPQVWGPDETLAA